MKIIVLSSHTQSLLWFRLDMMKEFIHHGHSVIAVGPDLEDEWGKRFEEHHIKYYQIHVERNGINPLMDIRTCSEIRRIIKLEKPDKLFAYQAKTVIYGSIAAKWSGMQDIYLLIAGLGSVFRGSGMKNYFIKAVMKLQYKLACKYSKKIFFQNTDDRDEFVSNNLIRIDKTHIINGSGVNLEKFKPTPLPEAPSFLFIGRLIKDKGIIEYLEACKRVKLNYPNVRCLLVGPFDSNPSALTMEQLEPYIENGIIEYFGEQEDVRPYISLCSTYVLPSYHEGTPKTVLEAMAMGRPIITSNAPGCKETVQDKINGFLVPIKDIEILYEKMVTFIEEPDLRLKMGMLSLKIVQEKYDVKVVNASILKAMELV